MKQIILITITFLSLSHSVSVGADITDGIPTSPAAPANDAVTAEAEPVEQERAVDLNAIGANPDSDAKKTTVEPATLSPDPEDTSETAVVLSKRAEFVQLFISTVFAGKEAAIETFTVENVKWLI